MTTESAPASIHELLAHRAWVRALARSLVTDDGRADDLEQDTWTRALAKPPGSSTSLRSWLGRVVRSVWIDTHRSERQRRLRELGSSRPQAQGASDVVAEADTHRRVVLAVFALDEPYRTTLLLRFFEGLGVRDVALRTDVPIETAKTRIRRGLARIRASLDAELGSRDGWCALLAPVVKGTGGVAVKTSTKTAVVVALIAGLAASAAWWVDRSPAEPSQPSQPDVADASPQQKLRQDAVPANAATAEVPSPFPGSGSIVGEVRLRGNRSVVANATVELADAGGRRRALAETDDAGRFLFPSVAPGLVLHVGATTNDAACLPLRLKQLGDDEQRDIGVLWLDARGTIEIRVETTIGSAEGVRLTAFGTGTAKATSSVSVTDTEERRRHAGAPIASARTAPDGTATLRVPAGPVALVLRRSGLATHYVPTVHVRANETTYLRAVLQAEAAVEGRLLDGDRNPIAGYAVLGGVNHQAPGVAGAAAYSSAETDADGRFTLRGMNPGEALLRVVLPGGWFPLGAVRAPTSGPLEFTLEFAAIEGVVRRAHDGECVQGAEVRATLNASGGSGEFVTHADERGRYRITCPTPCAVVSLFAQVPGLRSANPMRPSSEQCILEPGQVLSRNLEVSPSAAVHGTIRVGADPVAGADVMAYWSEPSGLRHEHTVADVAGRYEIDGLPADALIVMHASAPSLSQQGWDASNWASALVGRGTPPPAWSLRTGWGSRTRLDLSLSAGRTASGRVVDESGAPVPGARVFVNAEGTFADPAGEFVLRGIPVAPDTYVGARADGFVMGLIQLEDGREQTGLRIVLRSAARLRGVVVGPGGAAPPAGTLVRWMAAGQLRWYPHAGAAWRAAPPARVNDVDGSFDLALAIDASAIQVRAEAHGFSQAPVVLDVTTDTREYTVTLQLEPASVLSGRVVSADGAEPIANALIEVAADPAPGPTGSANTQLLPSAVTDANGSFTVSGLAPGPHEGRVSATDHARRTFEFGFPSHEPLQLRLERAVEVLAGVVVDADGVPVPGARTSARIEPPFDGGRETIHARTDDAGRFELRGPQVPGSTWTVMVYPPLGRGFPNRWVKQPRVATGRRDLRFELGTATTISGRILTSSGEPARGVQISARPNERSASWPRTTTDHLGAFVLEGVDEGLYSLRVDALAEDHHPAWTSICTDLDTTFADIPAGSTDLTLTLEAGAVIGGTLTLSNGQPLGGAWMIATPLDAQTKRANGQRAGHFPTGARADARGRFTIGGLGPGTYRLSLVDLKELGGSPTITPLAGAQRVATGTTDLSLRVALFGAIDGRVVDSDGMAVEGARVAATREGAAPLASVFTGPDGSFSLQRLEAADAYVLLVTKPGVLRRVRTEALRTGSAPIEISMDAGLRSTGTVLDTTGAPLGRQGVLRFVSEVSGHEFTVATDDAGKFDVSGLEEGDYRVEAVVLQSRAGGAIRGSAKIQAGDRDAELRFVE